MWIHRLLAVGLLIAQTAPAPGPLTEQQVERAIDRANKLTVPSVCVGRAASPDFLICLQGPEQRIAAAAAAAKQAHRHLRPADVPAEARVRLWTMDVQPSPPALVDGHPVRTPLAQDVALQLRDHPEQSVRPLNVARIAVTWNNAIGVVITGQGLAATFDPSTLPHGDLDVIIVVADGGAERRYILSQSACAQIR